MSGHANETSHSLDLEVTISFLTSSMYHPTISELQPSPLLTQKAFLQCEAGHGGSGGSP